MNDISKEKYDFYELVETYIDEGYSAEVAEELAWKMIQGNSADWAEPVAEPIAEAIEAEQIAEHSDRADEIPF